MATRVNGVIQVATKRVLTSAVPLDVAMVDADGNQIISFGGGVQYTEGDADATISGTAMLYEADSTAHTLGVPSAQAGLPVAIVAGSAAGSTQVSISTGAIRVYQSSAADLNVTVASYSTQVNVSSLGGKVLLSSLSQTGILDILTSSGASVMDSTESAVKVNVVAGTISASTQVTVSTGAIRTYQSTAADWLGTIYQSTAADLNVTVAGYSTIVSVSTGSVRVHQSTAADLNVTVAGYSTIVSVSTGSVRVHQSTAADLNVTVAGYSTIVSVSTGSVRVHQSTAADFKASVYQSTAADLNVTVAGYSTTANVSSLAGAVICRSSAADFKASVYQSTAADLNVTVAGYSTTVNVSSVGSAMLSTMVAEFSTSVPSSNSRGICVRPVMDALASFSTLTGSTATTLVSSNAATKAYVYAFSVTSTVVAATRCGFYSGSSAVWTMAMQAPASGIAGANLAVTPPAYLFKGTTGSSFTFNVEPSGVFHVNISYWTSS